jgi:hypothetical protein
MDIEEGRKVGTYLTSAKERRVRVFQERFPRQWREQGTEPVLRKGGKEGGKVGRKEGGKEDEKEDEKEGR